MQTRTQATNALDVARKIWVNEGPLAFYKVHSGRSYCGAVWLSG